MAMRSHLRPFQHRRELGCFGRLLSPNPATSVTRVQDHESRADVMVWRWSSRRVRSLAAAG
ncbi:hypothetical protein GBA52_020849 [Prunus armeniaca]|nr:hypothetical protein GBA52_020849 [Prunus armeniaca]